MTEKLYYTDAYIKEFSATVISSEKTDGGYDTVLSKTAFFPEEGGQDSDHGRIGDARVLHVSEKDGVIHHLTDKALSGVVTCKLDFEERFDKMQCHTAEHIVCGIIHRLYGFENVGFHLGADAVTFDVSGVIERESLPELERLANIAVFENLPVRAYFPSPSELSSLEYRSKSEIDGEVRIVTIGEVDSCACCAPHVAATGEIGIIKLLDMMKHRGGTRFTLAAGMRALRDYQEKQESVRRISGMLSTPREEVADTLAEYMKETENLRFRNTGLENRLISLSADTIAELDGSTVVFFEDLSYDALREICNKAMARVSGMLAAISGEEGAYRYVIASESVDMGSRIREINQALDGKGGGRGKMVQGTFRSTAAAIKDYFSNIKD